MNDKPTNHEPGMRAIDEMRMHPEWKLREMLADLHREYKARVTPIVKALAGYEALRPSRYFLLPMLPDDHDLIARIREAGEHALHGGMAGYKLVVNSAVRDGKALTITAQVVRAAEMYTSPAPEEQHSCAKSLDSRKSQQ
jgi:hypothetical protein